MVAAVPIPYLGGCDAQGARKLGALSLQMTGPLMAPDMQGT